MRRMREKLRLRGHSCECRRGLRSRDHKRHGYRRQAFLRVRGYCRRVLLIQENAFAFSDKYYAKWTCNEVNIFRNGKKVRPVTLVPLSPNGRRQRLAEAAGQSVARRCQPAFSDYRHGGCFTSRKNASISWKYSMQYATAPCLVPQGSS